MTAEDCETGVDVRLTSYGGPVDADDAHAAFKRAVRDSALSDPLPTFEGLAQLTGVPAGALVRYALVRWAAEGSEALLALGPRAVERLWEAVATAEEAGTDAARLHAYEQLRQQLGWLRAALQPDSAPRRPTPQGERGRLAPPGERGRLTPPGERGRLAPPGERGRLTPPGGAGR